MIKNLLVLFFLLAMILVITGPFIFLGLSLTYSIFLSLALILALILKKLLNVVSNFQFKIFSRTACQRWYPELSPLFGDLALHAVISTRLWPSVWAVFHLFNKRYLIINAQRWSELNEVEKRIIISNFFKEKDFYFGLIETLFLLLTYAPQNRKRKTAFSRVLMFFYYRFMVSLQSLVINSKQKFLSNRTWMAKKVLSKYNTEKQISF